METVLLMNEHSVGKAIEEARYNLATRVMSNGVEVIVAGDKSTFPGNPNFKRILPSTVYKPVTLKPSTLSDHMMMILPLESPQVSDVFAISRICIDISCFADQQFGSKSICHKNMSNDFHIFDHISGKWYHYGV